METIKEQLKVKFTPDLPFFVVGLPKELISKYSMFQYSFVVIKQDFLEIPCRVTQNNEPSFATFNTTFAEYIGLRKNKKISIIAISNELKPVEDITPFILSVTEEKEKLDWEGFLGTIEDIFVFNKIVFKLTSKSFIDFNVGKKDTIYTISKEFTRINNPRLKTLSTPPVLFLVINSTSMNYKEIETGSEVKSLIDLFEIPKSGKISRTIATYATIIQSLRSTSFYSNQNVGIIVAKDGIYDFVIFDEIKDTQSSINTKDMILKAFDNFVNFLNVHLHGEGFVDYTSTLTYVKNIIKKEKTDNAILFVFNDGSQFVGEHPSKLILELANLNVQFYPVCFNSEENPICELFEELFSKKGVVGRNIEFHNISQAVAEILSVINSEAFMRQIYGGAYD